MEVCSLEDDNYGDMFITQKSNVVPFVPNFDEDTDMEVYIWHTERILSQKHTMVV